MATSNRQPEQKNVVVNPSITTVFFEDQALAYNYKTQQWTRLPASSGKRFFAVQDSDRVLGTIEDSSFSLHVQDSQVTGAAGATLTMVTGEFNLNVGGRAIVDAVRPAQGDGFVSLIRVGVKDQESDSVAWSTGSAINSRSGQSNFRAAAVPAEGRYHRLEMRYSDGVTTVAGAEFSFVPAGKI